MEEMGGRGPMIQETKGYSGGGIYTARERKKGWKTERQGLEGTKQRSETTGRQAEIAKRKEKGQRTDRHLEEEQGGQARTWNGA